MQKLIVALDVDGVLRGKSRGHDGRLDPGPVAALDILRRHFELLIVILSTWKDLYDLSSLQRIIGPDVVGVTESLPPALAPSYPRYHEILKFIGDHGLEGLPWIALEDNRLEYPAKRNVYFTDPSIGLTPALVHGIIETFSKEQRAVQTDYSLDALVVHDESIGITDYSKVAAALAETIGVPLDTIGKLVAGTLVGDPRVIVRNLIEGVIQEVEERRGKSIAYDSSDFHASK